MAKRTRDELLARAFNDYKNYPYGFGRSGDFSIKESNALSEFGNLCQALTNGDIAPSNEEEQRIIDVVALTIEPETLAEKAWLRYLKRVNRQKIGSLNQGKPDVPTDQEEVDAEDQLDTDDSLVEID